MSIGIQPYLQENVPEVRRFNQRLRGKAFPFPETAVSEGMRPGGRISEERFLAIEDGVVRGGYLLKRQDFSIGDELLPIGCYRSALSEGIVDNKYVMVGVQLLLHALRREPMLYALGMGGLDRPLPRMLKAAGWTLNVVPFHFRVVHPGRFLRNIRPLRTTAARRLLLDTAARTGLGWAGIQTFQRARSGSKAAPPATVEMVDGFGDWADDLWTKCRPSYPFIGVRDRPTLGEMYPGGSFIRMKVTNHGAVMGWAVALDTPMRDDKHFGDLRVGSIVDCLALPEHAFPVISAARGVLEQRGVDLIVSNQAHRRWASALHEAGFPEGPSNFIFGCSKTLMAKLRAADCGVEQLFLNRGDGDGPIHL
jgi:hypothetical protein